MRIVACVIGWTADQRWHELAQVGHVTGRTVVEARGQRSGWLQWGGLAAVGALLALFLALANTFAHPAPGAPALDEPAPPFRVITFTGERLDLEELRGRPVVLNIWAPWARPHRQEVEVLQHAWQWYRDRDVVVISVAVQDTEDDARRYTRSLALEYPHAVDQSGALVGDYRVVSLPQTIFISRDGRVRRRHIGPLEPMMLRDTIEALLDEGGA